MTATAIPTGTIDERRVRTNQRLLAAAIAGPTFVALSFAQVPFRDGFDLSRHPFSFLLNGPGSAVQTVNFVLLGIAFMLSASRLRTVVQGRRGRIAALAGTTLGAGQVVAGLFAPGGAYGYPAGAPIGRPEHISASGMVHGVAFGVSMMTWVALLVVLALALRREHRRIAVISAVTAVVLLLVPGLASREDGATFIYLLVSPAFATTSLVFAHLHRLDRTGRTAR